jgi:hypothetical protein
MNTNTKFPPLSNSSFYHHYTKHGIVRPPITIINGINKPHSETISKESDSKEIHEHYSDNTSDSIVYEEKPTIQNVPLFQQPVENVFELSKFLKK